MKPPFLSVITINYNNLKGLKQTVDSVLQQTYTDYEYILIDGASNDGSAQFLSNNAQKFTYWESEKDNGIYSAINKGIRKAQGEYLLFLHSGDYLFSNKSLSQFIGNPSFEGDIVYGDYKFEEGEKIYPDKLTPFYFVKSSLPHQSTLFRKRVFDEMGLYNEAFKITSDREFYLKCFLDGRYQFKHIKYPLTFFDRSGLSNDPDYQKLKLEENHQVFKDYFGNHYEDYIRLLELERENNRLKRRNLKGFLNKVKYKLKNLWSGR